MSHRLKALLYRSLSFERIAFVVTIVSLTIALYSSHRATSVARSQISQPDIGVAQIIRKLRSELSQLEADRLSNGDAALFRVRDVDLELNFVVKVDQSNKGEFTFDAVTVGTDERSSLERTNKITVRLEIEPPTWAALTPAHLSDESSTELPYVPLPRK